MLAKVLFFVENMLLKEQREKVSKVTLCVVQTFFSAIRIQLPKIKIWDHIQVQRLNTFFTLNG